MTMLQKTKVQKGEADILYTRSGYIPEIQENP